MPSSPKSRRADRTEGEQTHLERELRLLSHPGFLPPSSLVGLPLLGSQDGEHLDAYFDVERKGRWLLETQRCRLRVRQFPDGRTVCQIKVKCGRQHAVTKRRERTSAILYLAGRPLDRENPTVRRALKMSGGRLPSLQFQLLVHRTDYHYLARDGAHLVLSVDLVDYPDGSSEHRVEVEVSHGPPALLDACLSELCLADPLLMIAQRGKPGEARYRLQRAAARL